MDGTFIVPSRHADFLELASGSVATLRPVQGKLFRKHILNKGVLYHPKTGETIHVDDAFVSRMQANFRNGVCPIVQVPLANSDNQHTESPRDNLGEVVGIEDTGSKVYALIDARKDAENFGKTYLGASAFLSTNYKDTRTNTGAGPALLHVAVTNRPYCTDLEGYEEIVAASADMEGDTLVLAQEESVPTKEELLAQLKAEHGIDVPALQAAATQQADLSGLTAALTAQLQGTGVQLSGGAVVTQEDIVGAVAELAHTNTAMSGRITKLEQEAAQTEVRSLIKTGRVLPAQEADMITLALTNREMFDRLVPVKPIVPVGAEPMGATPLQDEKHTAELTAEVDRLVGAEHTKQFFVPSGNGRKAS